MKKIYKYIICIIIGICVGIIIDYIVKPVKIERVEIKTPVEKIQYETLIIKRDSLIYKIKYITKIQHDTIEKVYNLDDSSTLKLFYNLVSE